MARIRDLLIVSVLLLVLSPVLLLCALAVRRSSPGPVLFRQRRLGLHARPFTLVKFRSMIHDAPDIRNHDGSAYTGDDDRRVTPVGRSEEHTSELQSLRHLVCRLLLEKKRRTARCE